MKHRKNIYLLAGGSWQNPGSIKPQFERILKDTGKVKPRVAYIGTASADDTLFYKYIAGFLKKAGALSVTKVLLARERADLSKVKAVLQASDAIFISGGDVEVGMHWLTMHGLIGFLKELYEKGVLFFGVSAGAIMLGKSWVRWRDPDKDSSAELFDCIGLAPIMCDTHAEKEGWNELKTAVRLRGKGNAGYGIPSGGVIRVSDAGVPEALYRPSVCYVNTTGRSRKGKDLSVTGDESVTD
jgi:peptidase E